jgi:hypothetical protein
MIFPVSLGYCFVTAKPPIDGQPSNESTEAGATTNGSRVYL